MSMNNILIIETTGYANNNPNLIGIINILEKNNFNVNLLTVKRNFNQTLKNNNVKTHFVNFYAERIIEKLCNYFLPTRLIKFFLNYSKIEKYDFIIGVDTYGVIFSNIISKKYNTPVVFVSYEIFFKNEVGSFLKKLEIQACSNILVAVSQDSERGKKLSDENKINIDNIINIPVSNAGYVGRKKSSYLNKKYNIPTTSKIVILAGSTEKWTMTNEILSTLDLWPEDWVLFLHNRNSNEKIKKKYKKFLSSNRLIISNESIKHADELNLLYDSSDLGIAFYMPTYESYYLGDNIKYLGMSSGKINNYIQFGLPVLINNFGIFSNVINNHKVGFSVNHEHDIPNVLNKINKKLISDYSANCELFFNTFLDLNKTIKPLLKILKKNLFN